MQVFYDLNRDYIWVRKVGAVFERLILQPKDVEVEFVTFRERLVIVRALATLWVFIRPARLSFLAIFGIVAGDKIVQVPPL